MRPYPGRGTGNLETSKAIFNYRLSRARRTIENSFGILASRWRIYRTEIIASPNTVKGIIQATVVLYNFIKNQQTNDYIVPSLLDRDENGIINPGN